MLDGSKSSIFLSTLSLRRATFTGAGWLQIIYISIHALLAESDLKTPCVRLSIDVFLSTLSLRRATACIPACFVGAPDFYPRSPCGERPKRFPPMCTIRHFYPRSPCGERQCAICRIKVCIKFLSTLSLRRATSMGGHEEPFRSYFYPRSPCGERHLDAGKSCVVCGISIHALLAESDHAPSRHPYHCNNFYPRSPCGERRFVKITSVSSGLFLSTLSLRRATLGRGEVVCRMWNFYPRSPCGERR